MKMTPKKIHLTTLGCSKNIYDSEVLLGQLDGFGAQSVSSPEDADVIIINTCGFIASAKQESIDAILEAEKIKQGDPAKKVIVCGCLSQRYGSELKKELPSIDGIFGTEDYQNILQFLSMNGKNSPDHLYEQRYQLTPSHYAYLKISEGCNHKCSFCAIPLMRGRHRSRPIEQIVDEARQLAHNGVKELILISQDTTFYGLDLYHSQKIVDLLKRLEEIDRLKWIRLHYLYPTTVQDELIDYIGSSEKVVPYLDMPIQHISDRMLKIMKRGGTSRRIAEIFDNARSILPNVSLRTTLIAGHPGETEEDFNILKDFVRGMRFDRLGVFVYSQEENTTSYELPDLPQELKQNRFNELMKIQQNVSTEKNRAKIGTIEDVLIDEVDAQNSVATGRTKGDSPEIDGEVSISDFHTVPVPGSFVRVRINDATEYDLIGKIEDI
jgi:ribosomal protein S12 methylthiotransferase